MKNTILFALLLAILVINTGVSAEERVDLEGATIIGNRELPKVLYVVPWKLPDQGHVISRAIKRQTHVDLSPLNRTKFHQLLELHTLRQGENQ